MLNSADIQPVGRSASGPRRAALIYHPIKVDGAKLKADVDRIAAGAGWGQTLWFETTLETAGQELTREALAQGAELLLAAGGDGTVRAVVEGLRGSSVPLGLIPSGTGNLLARNLNIGVTGQEAAITAAFEGIDRPIDRGIASIVREDGSVQEHAFVVMAGLGLDAKMIAMTNSKLKKAVGWLAYVDAGVRALPELKPLKIRYSIDNDAWRSTSVHTVMVGNCGSLPGGVLLIPDARVDDGVLDIMALRPEGPFGWLKIWRKITWENGVLRKSATGRKIIDLTNDVRSVTYRRGADLRLTVEVPEHFQLDGDEFGKVIAVHCWVEPGALNIRVAPPA